MDELLLEYSKVNDITDIDERNRKEEDIRIELVKLSVEDKMILDRDKFPDDIAYSMYMRGVLVRFIKKDDEEGIKLTLDAIMRNNFDVKNSYFINDVYNQNYYVIKTLADYDPDFIRTYIEHIGRWDFHFIRSTNVNILKLYLKYFPELIEAIIIESIDKYEYKLVNKLLTISQSKNVLDPNNRGDLLIIISEIFDYNLSLTHIIEINYLYIFLLINLFDLSYDEIISTTKNNKTIIGMITLNQI